MASEPQPADADSRDLTNVKVRLVAIGGNVSRQYPLDKPHVAIGSHPSNDIVLDDPNVSRRHATIARKIGRYQLTDLGSTNGTYVNGVRVRDTTVLRRGDEIRFGSICFAVAAALETARRARAPLRLGRMAAILALMFAAGFAAVRYRDQLDAVFVSRFSRPHNAEPGSPVAPVAQSSIATVPAAIPSIGADSAPISDGSANSPGWIRRINYYRAMAKLPPVVEDPKLSRGDLAHSIYLVKNNRDSIVHGGSGAEMHTEDPARPGFTPEGLEAAKSSDVDEWYSPTAVEPGETVRASDPEEWAAERAPGSPEWNIDGWIAIPFHRLPILNPALERAGFGMYCERGACAAALNLMTGTKTAVRGADQEPIEFPPSGSTVHLNSFGDEWPDPRASCPSYESPSGLAITLQLGSFIDTRLDSFSIKQDRAGADPAPLEACGYSSISYANPNSSTQQLGRNVLKNYGAVVLIPRAPLTKSARYSVSLTANGKPFNWTFTVAP
ncbi:MAG: garA 2 [Candidatus Binatus sp.]|nr:garA 2 [Candidatus Binatus sp.]